ncbi:ABC transporter ATP-binding protein/permease [Saprospiraceae bacterium]|nr:ABC transporter ATP-binding protein/permease [Saprospiraceae bacterium]
MLSQQNTSSNNSGFWRLLSRLKGYKKNVILAIVSNVLMAIFTVVSIPMIAPFFDILFSQEVVALSKPEDNNLPDNLDYFFSQLVINYTPQKALLIVIAAMLIVFFLKNIFRYLALYFMAPVRNGIIYDLRKQIFEKYIDLPLSFYSTEKKGDLMNRMTSDVQEIEWSILNTIEAIFKAPLIIVGSLTFMILVSPQLTLFVLVLIVFTAFIIGGISKTLKRSSSEVQTRLGRISSILEETLGGLRIIKGFNAQEYQSEKLEKDNADYRNILTRLLWRRDLSSPLSEFLGIVVVSMLLWYGSALVFDKVLTPDLFFAFIFAFFQVIEPAKSFSSAYYNIQKGLAAVDRVDNLLNIPNPIVDPENPLTDISFEREIKFEKVSFKYDNADTAALDQIDITINKGEVVALVGSSGAGKSTFVDLLPRFFDVSSGSIRIDGNDIRSYTLYDLRSLFGIVSQEAILFNDTIKNNILFGAEATDEQIEKAARIANVSEFVNEMPDKYQSNIGDRGMKLSGGQRQRLTIARAVLRNPPIMILDEATSALDSESELLVQDALEKLMKNRTTVVIAHRLSTIRNADKIVVLDKGKIVEMGSHEQLMTLNGNYNKFVEMQTFD